MMTTCENTDVKCLQIVDTRPIHWFAIQCGDSQLTVHRWNSVVVHFEFPQASISERAYGKLWARQNVLIRRTVRIVTQGN